MKLPVTGFVSIFHRVSGFVLFFGIAVLLYALEHSLASPQGFDEIKQLADGVVVKLIVWAIVAGLLYHFVAGVRHLLMDCGIGESLEGGKRGAIAVLVISAVLILLAGVWLW